MVRWFIFFYFFYPAYPAVYDHAYPVILRLGLQWPDSVFIFFFILSIL